MCSLTEILENSRIAGPLVRLACRSIDNVQTAFESAGSTRLFNAISQPFRRGYENPGKSRLLQKALNSLILLNLAGLLVGLSFLDTGPLGILTWTLLGLNLLHIMFRPDIRWARQFTVVDILVLFFVASAFISAGFSSYLKYSVIGLAKMSTFLAGYLSFRVIGITQNCKKDFLYGIGLLLALIGFTQALIGFYQFAHHVDARATWVDPTINAELNLTRVFGTLKPTNPNLLAGFLIPCLAAAIGVTKWQFGNLLEIARNSGNRKLILPAFFTTFLAGGAMLSILGTLVLTGSRGGFLAIAGIAAILFGLWGHLLWNPGSTHTESPERSKKAFMSRKQLKAIWAGILAACVAGAITVVSVSPQLQHRVTSIFAMRKDSSISYRLNVYNSVTRMIKDNPVVGIGPGNDTFKRVYGYYMVPGFNALGAYSVPLEITAEQGFIGLGIFALLLLTLGIRGLYFLETDRPLTEKMTAIVLLCGILASVLYGVFDTIWYRPSVHLLFWFYVALFVQLTRPLETQKRFTAPAAK